jgi:hypothetical protein
MVTGELVDSVLSGWQMRALECVSRSSQRALDHVDGKMLREFLSKCLRA